MQADVNNLHTPSEEFVRLNTVQNAAATTKGSDMLEEPVIVGFLRASIILSMGTSSCKARIVAAGGKVCGGRRGLGLAAQLRSYADNAFFDKIDTLSLE